MNRSGIITKKTREDGKIGNYEFKQINIVKKHPPKVKSIEIESNNYLFVKKDILP